jgi:uncharacterized lipoprotein YmbA
VKLILCVIPALLLAACSSPPPAADTQEADAGTRCVKELPIGSNIAVTRCRTAEQIARDRESVQSVQDAVQGANKGSIKTGGSGG